MLMLMFDFMYCERRRVHLEQGRGKIGVGRSLFGHEKGALGHGKGAFGASKGHTGSFEQGLRAMGRPKLEMLLFSMVFLGFLRV